MLKAGRFGDVFFRLSSKELGIETIDDPKNWDQSDREYRRNKKFRGVFSKLSNNIEFAGTGFSYLRRLWLGFGVNSDVTLTKYIKNPRRADERIEITETGEPNLTSLVIDEGKLIAKVKFDEGSFWKKINNRKGQKYDLTATNLKGVELGELSTRIVQAHGRRIFLKSESRVNPSHEDSYGINMPTFGGSGNRSAMKGLPFKVITNSDKENVVSNLDSADGDGFTASQDGQPGSVFFLQSNVAKENVRIQMRFKFTIGDVNADDVTSDFFRIYFRRYTGDNLLLSSTETLISLRPQSVVGQTFTINFDKTISIAQNESLGFIAQVSALKSGSFSNFSLDVELKNSSGFIKIEEDSVRPPTEHQTILPHEKFERIVRIITGRKDAFFSEYFGRKDLGYDQDGEGAFITASSGFMIRGFPIITNEGTDEEKKIQYPTSFKDAFESYDSITPLAVTIDGFGSNKRLRIEKIDFVYQKFQGVELTNDEQFLQVTDIKRKVDAQRIFSTIQIGSLKGGSDYEEAFGLDEFNGLSEFETIIDKVENIYKAVSRYRKDSYGHEFARRKQFADNPEEDTRYDKDIFMLDCKVVAGELFLKRFADDFELTPTGIYSPETAFNLNLSPMNSMFRHSKMFKGFLLNYPNDFINFTSSNAFSKLTTKKAGALLLAEDGRIKNDDLLRPLFVPEILEFKSPIDHDLLVKIQGLNKDNIPNLYGFFTIKTIDGKEQLYVDKVKISKEGKFTCTKAFV